MHIPFKNSHEQCLPLRLRLLHKPFQQRRARASFTPREIASLTMEFYRRNYIEGLFLSSAVLGSPDHTMELMIQTLELLRNKLGFNGYIHAKTIPAPIPCSPKSWAGSATG